MANYTLNDLTKEELEKILADGIAKEIAETHALGLPTTHGDSHGVYQIYPDGRKVYIKIYSKDKEKKERTV